MTSSIKNVVEKKNNKYKIWLQFNLAFLLLCLFFVVAVDFCVSSLKLKFLEGLFGQKIDKFCFMDFLSALSFGFDIRWPVLSGMDPAYIWGLVQTGVNKIAKNHYSSPRFIRCFASKSSSNISLNICVVLPQKLQN